MEDANQVEDKNNFYTKEAVQTRLSEENINVNKLSINELLASERTNLANKRNVLALKRNLQAAERTYSAWIRTGFSIVSAGVAFSGWLSQTDTEVFSNIVGSLLVIAGILAFIYAWYGYFETYKWLNHLASVE